MYQRVEINYFDKQQNCWYVNAWRTDDENEEGKLVALIDTSGECYFIEPDARVCENVQKAVSDKVCEIKKENKTMENKNTEPNGDIKTVISLLTGHIAKKVETAFNDNEVQMILIAVEAHNLLQEEEYDSQDYIYDINDPHDIVTCVRNGMTAQTIHDLVEDRTPCFIMTDGRHNTLTKDEIKSIVLENLNHIVRKAFMQHNGYSKFWEAYVLDGITDNDSLYEWFCRGREE